MKHHYHVNDGVTRLVLTRNGSFRKYIRQAGGGWVLVGQAVRLLSLRGEA